MYVFYSNTSRDAMFGSKDSTCPFFAFFSLAEILDVANPDGIVVSISMIKKFNSLKFLDY
jgi:hypothetical protein